MADWADWDGNLPGGAALPAPDSTVELPSGPVTIVTEGWYWIDLTPAGAGAEVFETCNRCKEHVHEPGEPDDKKPTVVQDAAGKTYTVGAEYDWDPKRGARFRNERWHVDAGRFGSHSGKLYASGSAEVRLYRYSYERKADGSKLSEKREKRVLTLKLGPYVVWDGAWSLPCGLAKLFSELIVEVAIDEPRGERERGPASPDPSE
jgi:hypothetical protein